jgi:Tol biopolymer transport system component
MGTDNGFLILLQFKMKKSFFVSILFLIPLIAYSQYQNPSSIHWKQIKTEHFIIVFPENISEKGIESARLLEHIYMPVCNSLQEYPKRIPLFLFNQSAISNGFTALAPRYVGFFTTPPQDATMVGGADWFQTLATHEYRHVVQFSKLDKNFTKFMGVFMGDIGKLIMMDVSVPQWFFEGDAVCTETVLSNDGRGRMPFFTRDIRAMELENIRYSYDKAFLGSYKNYYPDYYHLGYLMTAYVTKNFGADAWSNIMERSTNYSFWPFTFSKSIKRFTNSSLNRTYKNTLNEFNSIWTSKITDYPVTNMNKVNLKPKGSWTSYTFPYFVSDDSFVAMKNSLDKAPVLVLITKGSEKTLIGINPIDRIHSNGRFVVWSSETADFRWGQRSYADIMIYDLQKKSKKKFTRKGKYFAPAISPRGDLIAAVEYGSQLKCALAIFEVSGGKVINKYDIPDSCFIRMPSWSEDGKRIVFTKTCGQLKTISILNLENGNIRDIIPYGAENISNPVFLKNFILYNSPFTGIDAIFAVNIDEGSRYIVATGKYGVYNPCISPNKMDLVCESYTTNGFDIGIINSGLDNWTPSDRYENRNDNYFKYLVAEVNGGNIFDSTSNQKLNNYEIKKYSPFLHSITVHSWLPYPVANGIGFEVVSNDRLNTTSLIAGIDYFPDERASREFAGLSYAKFFPVFNFEFSYGRNYTTVNVSGSSVLAKTNEKLAKVNISLPFNFSRNIYTTTLLFKTGYDYIINEYPDFILSNKKNYTTTSAIESGLEFSNMKQLSLRDIYPKFGQSLIANYWIAPFDNGYKGDRLITSATFYFPGLFTNHSISISGGYENNTDDFIRGVYELTNDLLFVRGFANVDYDQFVKGTFVYSMPIIYPDLALGPVIYFKRIRGDWFYDYGMTSYDNNTHKYISTGLDLNVEFNLCRIPIPIEIGARYSYRISDGKNAWEFLFFGVAF